MNVCKMQNREKVPFDVLLHVGRLSFEMPVPRLIDDDGCKLPESLDRTCSPIDNTRYRTKVAEVIWFMYCFF